jgi:hypothetical protein
MLLEDLVVVTLVTKSSLCDSHSQTLLGIERLVLGFNHSLGVIGPEDDGCGVAEDHSLDGEITAFGAVDRIDDAFGSISGDTMLNEEIIAHALRDYVGHNGKVTGRNSIIGRTYRLVELNAGDLGSHGALEPVVVHSHTGDLDGDSVRTDVEVGVTVIVRRQLCEVDFLVAYCRSPFK